MVIKQLPFYKQILFWLLIPILIVGIACSTLLVSTMSSPLKAFLIRQFDSNLRLSSLLGLQTCEESFNYLLELRLEKNLEMNQTMKNKSMDTIKAISRQFPNVHLMVLTSGQRVKACSIDDSPEKLDSPFISNQDDTAVSFNFTGKPVRAHVQFFPFWDWHVISFVFETDYNRPIQMAYRITYLSALGVFSSVVITLLLVLHLFIKLPLNRLVTATNGVADGHFFRIDKIPRNEFGQLMKAFNAMVGSLENEKAEVQSLLQKQKENYVQLQAIYNSLPVILWSLDKNGMVTLSEGKELRSLGLKPGQVVGISGFELYKNNPVILENIKKGLNGEYCEYESDVQGTIYHSILTPILDKKNRVIGLNGLAVNVTEKKRIENELQGLRNYLSNIIDSMPSLIIGVDTKGCVTQWNKMVEKTTGISAENAQGKYISNLLPRMAFKKEKIIESIQTRQVIHEQKKHAIEKGFVYEDVTIFPLIANGFEGAVIRIDDVTDKVRLEEMMIQSEKMLSVGGLAAGMAHEINNPLAGMIQTANVMKSRLGNLQIPANQHVAREIGVPMEGIKAFMEKRSIFRMMEAITESGRRMAEIVDNMLSFARKTDASISSHDPVQMIEKIIKLAATDYDLKKQYDFKRIKIIKEYQDNLPMLSCEEAKIQQVLLNILRNGAQAMQSEDMDKNVTPCFILRLAIEKKANLLKIEIQDNGPGMDRETQKRIFEPFFTTKPMGIGTGLGLSVSYFIITENHGGAMDVISTPGKGATFIIRLPLDPTREENESRS